MPEQNRLEKAIMQQIRWDTENQVIDRDENGNTYPQRKVQFNPETLKVAFSNQLASGDDSGGAAIQFASKGTTKLSLDLLFDVTAPAPDNPGVSDVRKLTKEVVFFMQTKQQGSGKDSKHIPPGIRFQWGSFLFEGVMESINESLEFFSAEGRPLRATVSISLVKQDIDVTIADINKQQPGQQTNPAAAKPQQAARQGESLQQMAGRLGKGANWQDIARANNIETPRIVQPGTLIDPTPNLNITRSI